MKLCFPVKKNDGLNSIVYGHFGSAPLFLLYDDTNQQLTSITNNNQNHSHGMCQPVLALGGTQVDAIILKGIGAGALNKLNQMGVEVFQATGKTIQDNIRLHQAGNLQKVTVTCNRHGGGGGHGHHGGGCHNH